MSPMGRCVRLLAILLALSCFGSHALRAQDEPPLMHLVERPESQAIVVSLVMNGTSIGENMIVYRDQDRLMVPLNGVMTALELAITADPERGTASGYFINEDRRYELDLATGRARFGTKEFALAPGQVERQLTDIYVDAALFTVWFGIRFHLSMEDLSVLVSSIELLPVQERLERERRRSGVRRPGLPGEYTVIEPPPRWIDWPFIDTDIELSTNRDQGGRMTQQGQYTSVVTGQLGGLDYDMAANGTFLGSDDTSTLRATIGRRDPRGGLLGPIDAKEALVGDVSSPTLPLVSDSFAGRGATLSTFPLHRLSDLQRVTLRGDLPVGWQVELYRGGDLIDFQTSGSDGRYEFINVPTIPGLNAFKLIFYGPEGQRREEDRPIFVSAATVAAGETGYRVLFNQQNTDLLGGHPPAQPVVTPFTRFDVLARNPQDVATQANNGANRFIGEVEHGLSDTLSLNGAVSSIPAGNNTSTEFVQTGLRSSSFGALTTLDLATSSDGGIAYGAGAQSQFGTTSWLLSYNRFQNFVSQRSFDITINQPLEARTTARLYGVLPDFALGRMPFDVGAIYGQARNGEDHLELNERLSNFIGRFTVGAETQAHIASGLPTQTVEIFRVGTQFGKVGLRGEALYDVTPTAELAAAQVISDFAVKPTLNLRLGVTEIETRPQETQFTVGAAAPLKNALLGVDFNVSTRSDFSVLFKISFSFGVEPRHDSPIFRGESFARTGGVSPIAFLDRNGDGVFGPGDVPLPNVRFRGESSMFKGQTDQGGTTLITGLDAYQETPIALDIESLEDPYWKPADQKIAVLPRPGSVVQLNFPVYETGAIDGTVEVERAGQRVALPGIRLQALDANGKVAAQTLSGYDGSFFLEGVRLGRYILRVDPNQLARLHLAAPEPQAIALSLDKPTISAGTIVLARGPEPSAGGEAAAPRAAAADPKTPN
jgi:hypothetical protein